MTIWFTSDTHFGHTNIIKYCKRPFANADEMDEAMIANWNANIGSQDTVYHLGDFTFHSFTKTKAIFDRLNGVKLLVLGNHDDAKAMRRLDWCMVVDDASLLVFDVLIEMAHHPYASNALPESPSPQLCGHVHDLWKTKGPNGYVKHRILNVGVDQWGFTPISLDMVIDELGIERRLKPLFMPDGTRVI